MKKFGFAVTLLVGLVGGLLGAWLFSDNGGVAVHKESAYERVMRTGTIRCGYYMFKPMSWKDPTTGQMEGMAVAFAKELEKRSGIKMAWTEEVTFGNMYEGLKTGRYDAICTPTWPDGNAAKVVDYGKSWFYAGIIPIVRADETRFASYADFNRLDVRLVTQEGNSLEVQARTLFPQAKQVVLPPIADSGEFDTALLTGKADVMFCDMNRYLQTDASHPGKLKVLDWSPVQVNPFKMAVNKGEGGLNAFLSENVESMINDGTMVRIIKQYQPVPKTFLPVTKPYAED
ncbi:MAG: transporter substrate-binding domain-containing protein [Proteobacteria bacterium]|nr:transporter substrate-binding domain-containing protein [Pseudomonadota bacterium]